MRMWSYLRLVILQTFTDITRIVVSNYTATFSPMMNMRSRNWQALYRLGTPPVLTRSLQAAKISCLISPARHQQPPTPRPETLSLTVSRDPRCLPQPQSLSMRSAPLPDHSNDQNSLRYASTAAGYTKPLLSST